MGGVFRGWLGSWGVLRFLGSLDGFGGFIYGFGFFERFFSGVLEFFGCFFLMFLGFLRVWVVF